MTKEQWKDYEIALLRVHWKYRHIGSEAERRIARFLIRQQVTILRNDYR